MSVKGRDYVADIKNVQLKVDKWIENLEKSEEYLDKQVEALRSESRKFNDVLSSKLAVTTSTSQSNK